MNFRTKDKADAPKNKGKYPQRDKKEPKPPKKISARYLYNSGLAYLQKFPASSMHFRFIMTRKINKSCKHHTEQNYEECQQLLNDVVTQFIELGLLDDTAYLKGMVTSLRRRGLSATQITLKLSQKGYKRDEVNEELNSYDADYADDELYGDKKSAIIFARKRRFGPFDVMQKKDFDKSLASMARAGYSYDVAKTILSMSKEELPDEFSF